MTGEFAKLTDLELLALIHRAQQEIQNRKEAGREQLRVDIEDKLKSLGFDLDDIFPEAAKKPRKKTIARSVEDERKSPRAKYKNHVTGQTWSGRGGRPPQWVKDAMHEHGWESLQQFKTADEFLARD
jgi:DNA-binding protein H-NS